MSHGRLWSVEESPLSALSPISPTFLDFQDADTPALDLNHNRPQYSSPESAIDQVLDTRVDFYFLDLFVSKILLLKKTILQEDLVFAKPQSSDPLSSELPRAKRESRNGRIFLLLTILYAMSFGAANCFYLLKTCPLNYSIVAGQKLSSPAIQAVRRSPRFPKLGSSAPPSFSLSPRPSHHPQANNTPNSNGGQHTPMPSSVQMGHQQVTPNSDSSNLLPQQPKCVPIDALLTELIRTQQRPNSHPDASVNNRSGQYHGYDAFQGFQSHNMQPQ
jgi:hypothetical protein